LVNTPHVGHVRALVENEQSTAEKKDGSSTVLGSYAKPGRWHDPPFG